MYFGHDCSSSANIKLSKTWLSKMVQLGGFLPLPLILPAAFKIGEEVVKRKAPTLAKNVVKQIMNKTIVQLIKKFTGLEITVTNIEIEDFVKVVMSLENRGTLEDTSEKTISQEGGLLSFLGLWIEFSLPLIAILAKSVLMPLGLTAATSEAYVDI